MITEPVSLLADPDLVPLVQAIRAEILTGSASPEDIALSLLEQPEAYPDPEDADFDPEGSEDEEREDTSRRSPGSAWPTAGPAHREPRTPTSLSAAWGSERQPETVGA